MKNYLTKMLKYIPRKIKKKIIAEIKTEMITEITGIKTTNFKRYFLVNKFLIKRCTEILSGVEFVGQELQDMYAYLYFNGKKDGFFIDIGAYDGITISNTYAFENIGWKGICVEPVQEIYQKLINNRKCDCVNAAVYSEESELELIQTRGGRSGFIRNMSKSMIKEAEKEGIINKYTISTISFESLIKKYNIEYIDFLSIDVEGSEPEVLESIDFNKYKFGLITIENNHGERITKYMYTKGYKLFLDLGVDLFFIPQNIEIGKYWWIDP